MESNQNKISEIENQLQGMITQVERMAKGSTEIADVERTLLASLLSMSKDLTEHFVSLRAGIVRSEGTPIDSKKKK